MPSDSGRTITREQKMGAAFLLVFGVLTIGLGWLQLHNTLYAPFVIHPTQSASVAYTDDKTKLQQIDTDHDGISDYDELEFYKTSPYLPDTDSDGIPDKQEIDRGSDPLCPEGQSCKAAAGEDVQGSTTTPILSPLLQSTASGFDQLRGTVGATAGAANVGSSAAGPTPADVQALAKNPQALREILLKSGKITEADLKKIDDATLMTMASQIVGSQAAAAPAPSQGSPTPTR